MKRIVVSFSGGKDSTATLILALRQYPKNQVIPIFADTGWEHPLLYDYIEYVEKKLDITVVRVKSSRYENVLDLIKAKRMFPSSIRRFCTDELKRKPILAYIEKLLNQGYEVEQWIGIRANESENRKQRYGHLSQDDIISMKDIFPDTPKRFERVKVRYPIVNLTANEVYKIIVEAGLEINPLYHKGYERVGCFPCVIAGFKDYKRVWQDEIGRERILELVNVEEELNKKGYNAWLKPDKTGKEIVKLLQLNDAQGILFEDEGTCGFCHY